MTLEMYRGLAANFNKLPFYLQIKTLQEKTHILQLCADHNWWVVKVRDKEIQEQLEELDEVFSFKNQEWGSDEMDTLAALLGFDIGDA